LPAEKEEYGLTWEMTLRAFYKNKRKNKKTYPCGMMKQIERIKSF